LSGTEKNRNSFAAITDLTIKPVGDRLITEWRMMKTFTAKILIFSALLLVSAIGIGLAQDTTSKEIARQEAALEKKRLELEKKSLELQEKELALEKAKMELQYQQSGRSLSMNLSGDVLFDYEKAALKPAAEEALKKVAVVLSQFPESNVTVEGYTDSKGGKGVNLPLSRERALAVKDWLVKNGNVPSTHITAKGFGEENPAAPNTNADGTDNPAGRALNRRVTIIVEKPAVPPPGATP
jgi:outer membrane protein OmpA-like peptidoglycan-associated protein